MLTPTLIFSTASTSRISDWTLYVRRTITDLNIGKAFERAHFMVIQIAACGC
jgi:hypothetical protein